jgi:hypothetical protein
MRIGILTFHSAHNYGAILQAYALRKIISKETGGEKHYGFIMNTLMYYN